MFPSMQTQNLQGRKLFLPRDLEATFNLLVLAFSRSQQADVDTWKRGTEPLRARWKDLSFYELPTIEDPGFIARKFIDGGMKLGIKDPDTRAHVLTLYLDKAPFLEALEITSQEVVHALLVDQEGRIVWRAQGAWTDAKGQELEEKLSGEHAATEPQLH